MDLPSHWYTIGWRVWLIVTIGGFGVLEVCALWDADTGDTLTEHTVAAIKSCPMVSLSFLAFLCWLVVHFGRRLL